jgi:NADPH:quinone reductase-like Zn-dependent oxidoreductase
VLKHGSETGPRPHPAVPDPLAASRASSEFIGGDATGTLLDVVGWDAKIVCYAAPTRGPIKVNPLGLVAKRASIHPFFMYYPEHLPKIPEKIRAAAALVASHQLRAPIAGVYAARRLEQALAHALAGGKILLDFTDGS